MKTFTQEELNFLKEKINNYTSPWISRKIYWLWFKFLKFTIFPLFVVLIGVGAWNNSIGH